MRLLKQTGNNTYHVYFISIFLSQFLSNVPPTFLLAPFTNHYYALFLGSNIGGLGTIIASPWLMFWLLSNIYYIFLKKVGAI